MPTTTVLPTSGTWNNVTSNLAGMASECGNLTSVSAMPGQDAVIAGVANRGLWRSTNGGASWTALGTGAGTDTITNRPTSFVYDPTNSNTFWESGIYNSGGVYRTTDSGATFQRLGNVVHVDQVAVDLTDPGRRTLVAGGHEQTRTVWRSGDSGATWTNIGLNLPTGTGFSSNTIVINSTTYLVNSNQSWSGGSPGIYRTANSGASWTKVSSLGPTGNAAISSNGTIYWRTGNSVAKSTDQGQTWTSVGNNLAADPVALPDGRILAASYSNVVVSADGNTWTNVGPNLPYTPASLTFLAARNTVLVARSDCGNSVPNDAIYSLR